VKTPPLHHPPHEPRSRGSRRRGPARQAAGRARGHSRVLGSFGEIF